MQADLLSQAEDIYGYFFPRQSQVGDISGDYIYSFCVVEGPFFVIEGIFKIKGHFLVLQVSVG